MEHIKKKLAVIVVFFAVFIGIVTIWTVRKQSQPKLTAVTWKLEEEADLDGNELSSYAKDPSKSKVVLTFKKDQTYRCKNLENKKIWKGTYTLSRTNRKIPTCCISFRIRERHRTMACTGHASMKMVPGTCRSY